MPRIDLDATAPVNTTGYPPPFNAQVAGRWFRRLAPIGGLGRMGASHVRLEPGAWSSQRHWHEGEDELLIMLSGEAILVEDSGRTVLRAGDICAWPAGVKNGHHLINEGDTACTFVVVSAGEDGGGGYSDIDMMWTPDGKYRHKDGTPYPSTKRPA